MSFTDRFEILELLRAGDVQTFRGRERSTGRDVEVHLSVSSEALPLAPAIDRGTQDGKFYVVTLASAPDSAALDSAGAWRVGTPPVPKPAPEPTAKPTAEPGDFTRMFHLQQAPEALELPPSNPRPAAAPSSQPGSFTRAIQKPSAASPAATSSPQGEAGEFTRMFQKPAAPAAVPQTPAPVSNLRESASPGGFSTAIKVALTLVLLAIAVFILMKVL